MDRNYLLFKNGEGTVFLSLLFPKHSHNSPQNTPGSDKSMLQTAQEKDYVRIADDDIVSMFECYLRKRLATVPGTDSMEFYQGKTLIFKAQLIDQ